MNEVHEAINAYNAADTRVWRAKQELERRRDRLIRLLRCFPATTSDRVIRHHIICTERRELTPQEMDEICK